MRTAAYVSGLIFCCLAAVSVADAQTVPRFEFETEAGRKITNSDLRGKVVLINFWATWCPPCKQEMPELVYLQKKYRNRGFLVLGVSLDEGGGWSRVRRYIRKLKINFPVVRMYDRNSYGGELDSMLEEGIPETWIVDRQGDIYDYYVGAQPRWVFESDIEDLL